MDLTTIFPLISSVCVFLIGIFVFFRNPKSRLHVTFFLHALSITGWLFGTFMLFLNKANIPEAIFWDRFVYSSVVFIPAFMYHFCLALTNRKRNAFLYLAYTLSLIFLLISRTDYFVKDAFVYKWGIHTKAQFFHHLFLIYFSTYAVAWFFVVYRYYRKLQSSTQKYQIKYFFIAFLFLFSIGPLAYLPAYGISIYPFSYLSGLIFSIILGYAIVRHRLMDIRLAVRKTFIYIGISVFVYVTYSMIILGYTKIFGSVFSTNSLVAGVVVAPAFVAMFLWFHHALERFSNRYLFYSLYNYQQTITNLTKKLNESNDLDQIITSIVDTIKVTMQLNRAGVLLISKENKVTRYKIAKVIGFDEQNGISLVQDNFLTQFLRKTQKPIALDELEFFIKDSSNVREQNGFRMLESHMRKIEASMCLPLLSNNELIGIIVLGSKISGDAYTTQDFDLLNTLSYQAGIAIQNARLYKETKEFSRTLQQKVDEQTKDLKAQAEHQKKLLEMRSEFLDIASHQLKTPVSVILGTLSLFKEGSMDKVTQAERDKFIDNIFRKAKKLGTIINDILRASEMDTDEFKLVTENIKPTQAESVIAEAVEDLQHEAEEKGLTLEYKKPRAKLPQVMADADFLEQAIFNLVDNALKYTAKGFVRVAVTQEGNSLVITVADSGIGIPADDQKKIFDKFNRAKNAVNMYTDGSGLGLFIVKKIIEAHGGTISFVSEENKGTTFTVTMPVKIN